MNEITNILESGEKVTWEGKPKYAPFIFGYIFTGALLGGFAVFFGIKQGLSNTLAYALAPVVVAVLFFFGNVMYRVIYYAVTDKRAIFQTGIFGRSFKSIDYDNMQNVSVDIGLVNYLFGTGTIKIFSGETGSQSAGSTGTGNNRQTQYRTVPKYDYISSIENPYQVLKLLQESLSNRKEESVDILKKIEGTLEKSNPS